MSCVMNASAGSSRVSPNVITSLSVLFNMRVLTLWRSWWTASFSISLPSPLPKPPPPLTRQPRTMPRQLPTLLRTNYLFTIMNCTCTLLFSCSPSPLFWIGLVIYPYSSRASILNITSPLYYAYRSTHLHLVSHLTINVCLYIYTRNAYYPFITDW